MPEWPTWNPATTLDQIAKVDDMVYQVHRKVINFDSMRDTNAIEVWVNKSRGGYNFVILPSNREKIVQLVPSAHPANSIFVAYDWKNDFVKDLPKIESYIYPVLLGIDNKDDLKSIGKINFIDPMTQNVLNSIQL